jgi:hypothetical protein
MIWVQGATSGGRLGQLVMTQEQADKFCATWDSISSLPIAWTLVHVSSTDSRDAHAEAQKYLQEISEPM